MNRSATVALFAGGVASLTALFAVSAGHERFRIRQRGLWVLDDTEVLFYGWFGLFGLVAVALLAAGLNRTALPDRLAAAHDAIASRPAMSVPVAAALAALFCLGFRVLVLQLQPIADDEDAYLFMARTLLEGRVTNPAPEDPWFVRNQFIIVTGGWHGKYPIGHSLMLALGELVGLVDLVPPLIAGLCVLMTYRLALPTIGPGRAPLAALLLLFSPHFLWTHGTLLSQTSSTLAMLVGAVGLLTAVERGGLRWALLSGAAFGFGVLVRPLPGVLFALVAALYFVASVRRRSDARGPAVLQLAVGAVACALVAALVALTNHLQAGDPMQSGYHAIEGARAGLDPRGPVVVLNSLGAALLRENFWLFGWPLSLLFVAFARPARGALLLWGLMAAGLAYRVVSPKVVVGTTGPVYLTEIVPLLCLATADGIARSAQWVERRARGRGRSIVAAVCVASSVVALVAFVPVVGRAAGAGANARLRVHRLLSERGATHPLVFTNQLVAPERDLTWAYYPPSPELDLSDEVLFVRLPTRPGGVGEAHAYWRRRFPDRRAFVFIDQLPTPLFLEFTRDPPIQAP